MGSGSKKRKRSVVGTGRLAARIRRAVEASGVTRARLCRAAGIEEAAMSRFMRGLAGLTLTSVERLADVLGLEVVQRGPIRLPLALKRGRAKKKGGKPCATTRSVG